MDKLKNLSIRKSIIIYLIISLLASLLLWMGAYHAAFRTQTRLVKKYAAEETGYESIYPDEDLPGEDPPDEDPFARPDVYIDSDRDRFIMQFCDFILTYGFLIFAIPGVVFAVLVFYRNKIQKPLLELSAASRRIEENDLDFHITYKNNDELGQLCVQFERMRAELESNNQKMWRMVEAEKLLRAAIAHDIRTPLATLRGYQEMMLEFLPQGALSPEKTEEMLRDGMEQIDRLSSFVETMRVLSGLESREAVWEQMTLEQLEAKVRTSAHVLEAEYGRNVVLASIRSDRSFLADSGLILEVAENLMSNALRYANEKVSVRLFLKEDALTMEVLDDGKGYPQGFFLPEGIHQIGGLRQQPGQHHLGIGLYISRICCEKHGGRLTAENRSEGGAVASAVFQVK